MTFCTILPRLLQSASKRRNKMTLKKQNPSSPGSNYTRQSASSSPDEFVIVDDTKNLPTRKRDQSPPPQYPLSLDVQCVRDEQSLIVSINPPREPESDIKHVPCDIVLVIDVSGSMADPAPLLDNQDKAEQEVTGLSILDLTKHAARTIMETLNKGDRLGIVTFSADAKIIQPLTVMTEDAKKQINKRIEALTDEGATNLWAGIRTGLQLFESAEFSNRVQGLYVLTDGMPNHMCPSQGYVAKLKPMLRDMAKSRACIPTIHTFGFGYHILSNLLQSIAEVGHGNYAFIPDAGMIGTVFVHAVANLYTTYATSAVLTLTMSRGCCAKSEAGYDVEYPTSSTTIVKLGHIQFGQSRDIVLKTEFSNNTNDAEATVSARLSYTLPSCEALISESGVIPLTQSSTFPQARIEYLLNRSALCTFLASLFPYAQNGEHARPGPPSTDAKRSFENIVAALEASSSDLADPDLSSLLNDVRPSSDTSSDGQVTLALTETSAKGYWNKWGKHYLPGLLHAHLHQQCNSFKDPGPLRYGINSPLFIKCRDELDNAFDNLPAPKPSLTGANGRRVMYSTAGGGGGGFMKSLAPVKMSRYNYADYPCFLGTCPVQLADGTRCNVQDLKAGDKVYNGITKNNREVVAILKTVIQCPTTTSSKRSQICQVGDDGLWITPQHPVLHHFPSANSDSAATWTHPNQIANKTRDLQNNEAIYSILLEPSSTIDDHAMEIGGVQCITLGHGLKSTLSHSPTTSDATITLDEDVRTHGFLGDYAAVTHNLAQLSRDEQGRFLSAGIEKDAVTGWTCRFIAVDTQNPTQDKASAEYGMETITTNHSICQHVDVLAATA